jgi:hypothetical protein
LYCGNATCVPGPGVNVKEVKRPELMWLILSARILIAAKMMRQYPGIASIKNTDYTFRQQVYTTENGKAIFILNRDTLF